MYIPIGALYTMYILAFRRRSVSSSSGIAHRPRIARTVRGDKLAVEWQAIWQSYLTLVVRLRPLRLGGDSASKPSMFGQAFRSDCQAAGDGSRCVIRPCTIGPFTSSQIEFHRISILTRSSDSKMRVVAVSEANCIRLTNLRWRERVDCGDAQTRFAMSNQS
jgi:hypothetical protein